MAKSSLKYELVFIGSGNIANALAFEFQKQNHNIKAIYSKNELTGNKLAAELNCDYFKSFSSPFTHCDFLFLCVPDNQISEIAEKIILPDNCIIVHTSGTVSNLTLNKFKQFGVFYPLQSFSLSYPVEIENCPVMIEGNNENSENKLLNLAQTISKKTLVVNSDLRAKYHLAAVIANNFTNYLLVQAELYCKNKKLDFSLLHPLILEGTKKALKLNPENAQTGPALRNDDNTIMEHLSLLEKNQELKNLYQFLTERIRKMK